MQTQSTPSNHPSLPFFTSLSMSSSRPSLPLSSMPSKQNLKLTGNSRPSVLCASRMLTHPRTGPLSSEDPRPIRRPVALSIVRMKGSVSQPSDTSAWKKYLRIRRLVLRKGSKRVFCVGREAIYLAALRGGRKSPQ